MRVIETTVYFFDELSEKAQKKALSRLRDVNVGDEWWDLIYDKWKKELTGLGFEKLDFSFIGFSSQGDGFQFTGDLPNFFYLADEVGGLRKNYKTLIEEGEVDISWTIRSSGMYCHEKAVSHYFDIRHPKYSTESLINSWADANVVFWYETTCKTIYRELEASYDYLTSDEKVLETIKANEYEFTEDGKLI